MPGPWEKYQQQSAPPQSAAAPADGPWSRYQSQQEDAPSLSIDIVGGTSVPSSEYAKDEGASYLAKQAKPAEAEGSLFGMGSDYREKSGAGMGDMFWAAAKDMFGSREGAAQYLADQYNKEHGLSAQITGGAQVVKADDGEPALRLPDGTTYRLNDKGLDSTDIGNLAGNVAAFWTPASWAARFNQARGLGLLARAGVQGATAGATDAAIQYGVNGEIDPIRTVATTAGGGGGEVLGTALAAGAQRGINAFRNLTGQTAQDANALARSAGIPAGQGDAAALREGAQEIRAGADPRAIEGAQRFGFQYSQGQKALDPGQKIPLLNREELLRQSPGGQEVFERAARGNRERLVEAVDTMGGQMGGQPGATPAELAQGAAGRLGQQANDLASQVSRAYEKAAEGNRTAVGMEYVVDLPRRLVASVQDFAPNATTTPATAQTLRQLRTMTETLSRGMDGANVKGVTLKALEAQRRILNKNIDAAANKADRAAMVAMKREFDSWLDGAVDSALVSGSPESLAALKDARQLRAEFARRFEGGKDSDKFITGLLDGTRTPEELVNIALGAGAVSKSGAARFIQRLKVAAGNDPEVIGNLRAAQFLRMTTGKNGEPLDMGQIIRNIKSTEHSNGSIVKALYTPEEWAEVKRLADALEPLVAKGDYARTSGSAERLARMLFAKTTGGLPLVGEALKGFGAGINAIKANRALTQPLKLPAQSPAGFAPAGEAAMQEWAR